MAETAAGVMLDTLNAWGIDVVFGLPGDGINGIMEGLRKRQDRIRFIQVRHEEAAAFMANPKNNDKVRAAIGKYIKLPPDVIAKVQISPPGPVVTEKQLAYWVGLMKDQDMLKTTPDVTRLIVR